ncbi:MULTISPECIES: hypothetical protein [unclassified Nocardioides]|uniref:hypothetical protein n=1 Tax=unclassified Nocardioides TaxID=2615069 RepID=UPI00301539B1
MTTRWCSIELPHGLTAEMVDAVAGARPWRRWLSVSPQIRIKRSRPGEAWRLVIVEAPSTDLPTTCRISVELDGSGRRLVGTSSITVSGHVVLPAVLGLAVASLSVLLATSAEAAWWWWLLPIAALVVLVGPAWWQATTLASDEERLADHAVEALVATVRQRHPDLPAWPSDPTGDRPRYVAAVRR